MGFPSSDNWFLRPGTSKPGGGGRRSRGDAGGQRPSFGENRRSTGVGGQNEEEPREVEQLDSSFSLEDNSSGGSIENVGSGSVEANRGSEEAELDSLGARIRGEVQRRQEELQSIDRRREQQRVNRRGQEDWRDEVARRKEERRKEDENRCWEDNEKEERPRYERERSRGSETSIQFAQVHSGTTIN